jgi:4-diphosphocytidyl-2-C-methyl-D-erythritol kinase
MVLIKQDTILSPAKINLFLKVIKKQSNGLHQIYSLVSHVNLFDKIYISESSKDQIKFIGKFSKNISLKKNSIFKVMHYLRFYYPFLRKKKFNIKVEKNIPSGAGLGGGTSNAVSLLKFILQKYELQLNKHKMKSILKKIGSDSYIFLNDYQKIIYGTGDKYKKFKSNLKLNLFLIFPNKSNLTQLIYKSHQRINVKYNLTLIIKSLHKNKFKFFEKNQNDLLFSAIKNNSRLKKLFELLKAKSHLKLLQLTGSGSCCFVVLRNKKNLLNCQKIVKKHCKSYWTAVVKTTT